MLLPIRQTVHSLVDKNSEHKHLFQSLPNSFFIVSIAEFISSGVFISDSTSLEYNYSWQGK